jgi:hypothetical protein
MNFLKRLWLAYRIVRLAAKTKREKERTAEILRSLKRGDPVCANAPIFPVRPGRPMSDDY